jgi:hypothetical protein
VKNLKETMGDKWYSVEDTTYMLGAVLGVIPHNSSEEWNEFYESSDVIDQLWCAVGELAKVGILQAGKNGTAMSDWQPDTHEWHEFRWNSAI